MTHHVSSIYAKRPYWMPLYIYRDEIAIPDALFTDELVELTETERTTLINSGLKVLETPSTGITRIQEINRNFPSLSIYDCFAFVLAESLQNSVL